MSVSSSLTSCQKSRVVEKSASATCGLDGGSNQVPVTRVRPGPTGSRRITNTWLGSTLSRVLGNRAMKRPLAMSEWLRPSTGGMADQSPRSSFEMGVVV